jgi:hypothetical protein
MFVSYLGFFFLGSVLSLAILAVPLLEGKPDSSGSGKAESKRATR